MGPGERERRRQRLRRYVLFQIPGTLIVAAVLFWAVSAGFLSRPVALALMLAWVLKDTVLYRVVAIAYEPDGAVPDPLLGARGVVLRALDPSGYVRIGPERWRAVATGGAAIPEGAGVRVHGRRELTLEVVAESDPEPLPESPGDAPVRR